MSNAGGSVTITVAASAFFDLYGQASAQVVTKFSTPAMTFTAVKNHNTTLPFAAREGATMYYTDKKLMLYGGKKMGTCSAELYTSVTGKTWNLVTPAASSATDTLPGAAAYARTAMDASGAVWMLGKGDCADTSTTIYTTKDAGATWSSLKVPTS